ncbi:AMP-binding protein [Streptomyces sp. NPDC059474]|uniref:AMP-binding protein n=1 Tax=Streptomyces sp. NPDC059474 TaxID=3346846 RepID=UPI0036AF8A76
MKIRVAAGIGYGPTENTTFTTTHTLWAGDAIDGPLPIGRPITGTRVYVLDREHRLVPPVRIGELYAAGAGLATGYLGDELETRRRFGRFSPDVRERLYRTGDLVRLDPDGNLLFLGRVDKQIKLNGHRIEPELGAGEDPRLPGRDRRGRARPRGAARRHPGRGGRAGFGPCRRVVRPCPASTLS